MTDDGKTDKKTKFVDGEGGGAGGRAPDPATTADAAAKPKADELDSSLLSELSELGVELQDEPPTLKEEWDRTKLALAHAPPLVRAIVLEFPSAIAVVAEFPRSLMRSALRLLMLVARVVWAPKNPEPRATPDDRPRSRAGDRPHADAPADDEFDDVLEPDVTEEEPTRTEHTSSTANAEPSRPAQPSAGSAERFDTPANTGSDSSNNPIHET